MTCSRFLGLDVEETIPEEGPSRLENVQDSTKARIGLLAADQGTDRDTAGDHGEGPGGDDDDKSSASGSRDDEDEDDDDDKGSSASRPVRRGVTEGISQHYRSAAEPSASAASAPAVLRHTRFGSQSVLLGRRGSSVGSISRRGILDDLRSQRRNDSEMSFQSVGPHRVCQRQQRTSGCAAIGILYKIRVLS